MYKQVNYHEFHSSIREGTNLKIVQFTKNWSGACEIMTQMLGDLSEVYSKEVKFYNVNIDEDKLLEYEFGILETPSILFFKSNEIVDYITGLVAKQKIKEKIESLIQESSS